MNGQSCRRRWAYVVLAVCLAATTTFADPPQRKHWIVLVAPQLRAALQPLVEHRQRDGFTVQVIAAPDTPDEALRVVRAAWQGHEDASSVLLVGAPRLDWVAADDPAGFVVPALPGTAGRMRARLTDDPYGCRPGEQRARVPVGRLPACSVAELDGQIRKILAFEAAPVRVAQCRRFVVLAGPPEYNAVVDQLVERLTRGMFDRVDPTWSANVIYASTQSPFNLPRTDLAPRTGTYLKAGQLFTLYVGHSNSAGCWFDADGGPYLSGHDWSTFELPACSGVFVTTGCWGTAWSDPWYIGYGIVALRNPRGPVAVIGSEEICYAAMAMLIDEGLLTYLPAPGVTVRLGDLWLALQHHLADAPLNPLLYRALDAVDGDPNTPQADQRREHLEMFMLLGDPALRLPTPNAALTVEVSGVATPGGTLQVRVPLAADAESEGGRIELRRPFLSDAVGLQDVSTAPPAERAAWIQQNHRRANDWLLADSALTRAGDALVGQVTLPAVLPWPEVVARVIATAGASEAVGAAVVPVRAAAPATRPAPASAGTMHDHDRPH